MTWDAATLPSEVAGAFASEGVASLAGTFGNRTLGEPVEIDELDLETDTDHIRIMVYNRGIGLMGAVGPELLRLHRFFSVIDASASDTPRRDSR